jgi:hypothetical protein
MKEKISCLGTDNVPNMNSPALICQPVSASDKRNPTFDNERERNRMRKRELAKEGMNILDLYLRKSNNDKSPSEPLWRATRLNITPA